MICAAEADFLSCMHLSNCMTEQSNCTLKTCGSFAISTSSNQVHEDQMLVTQVFNRENKHRENTSSENLLFRHLQVAGTSRNLDEKIEMLKKVQRK